MNWRRLKILGWLTPNNACDATSDGIILFIWFVSLLFVWMTLGAVYLPSPMEVLRAFPKLWYDEGIGQELWTSMALNFESIAIMFVISYGLAVATVMPFFRPLATLVSLGRFCGFVGLPLVFMSVLQNTHSTKVALLVFGMGVYTVLSLTKLFDSVPKDLFDHSRTLRMGEWRVVWEVIILGTSAQVIDILRINIAMGWMMLPLVEGRYKSEGGVGALMEIENKHLNLDMVFCAMFLILVVGFLQDYLIGIFKAVAFEWSMLGMERR